MRTNTLLLITILIFLLPGFVFSDEDAEILTYGQKYFVPLGHDRSSDYNKLDKRIIGRYGDYRKSHVPGHRHSGIDIKGKFNEPVYSTGDGMTICI